MSYSNSSATIETRQDQNGSSLEYRATVSSRRSSNESSSIVVQSSVQNFPPVSSTPLTSTGPSRPVISGGISEVIGRATTGGKDCQEPPAKLPDCNGQSNPVTYLSEVEAAILRSSVPIDVNETEEITVLGQKGIWTNKSEVANWRGIIPITEYKINEDGSPEVITKRTDQKLTYIQELAIRYLRPPTPPAPGEILITQECNCLPPPAPPLIIRQQPCRPSTPEPLVIREAPPKPPCSVGRKVITISGKRMPPPPRKVVIERLAPLPTKPQAVLIERWLPYSQVKRRVIYQRACEQEPVAIKPKNVIVQWEAPQVVIKKDFKYLGVIRANPVEYVQRYGSTLKTSKELPDFVLEIKPPSGITLAADYQYNEVHELEGDLQALRLVDLEKEGLSEYRAQLEQKGINYVGEAGLESAVADAIGQSTRGTSSVRVSSSNNNNSSTPPPTPSTGVPGASATFTQSVVSVNNRRESTSNQSTTSSGRQRGYIRSLAGNPNAAQVVADIFAKVDLDQNGKLSVEEAEKVLLKINSRLGRQYGEDDVKQFFQVLDTDKDGSIDLDEFRAAFERDL